ncbi:MAG: TolC family protein [Bacillota bacterium]
MNRLKVLTILTTASLALLTASVSAGGNAGGLTLEKAVETARSSSPAVELAEVQQEKAELEAEQAAEAARTIPADSVDSYSAALLKYLYPEQALVSSQLARRRTRAAREDVALQVETAYRGLQMARQMARATEVGLRVAREGLGVARDMHASGMITRAEVLVAEREVEAMRSMWVSSQVGGERAALALALLLGRDPGEDLVLAEDEPRHASPEDIDLEAQVGKALRDRYEIAEANAMVDVASYQLDLAREYPPDPSFRWSDLIPFDPPEGDGVEDEYTLPIAQLEYREARLVRTLQRSEVEHQVRTLYWEIRESEQRVEEARAGLRAAEEAWRVARLKFDAEMLSRLDLLRANLERIQCEAGHVSALYEHELAVARFQHACGRGSSAGLEGGI